MNLLNWIAGSAHRRDCRMREERRHRRRRRDEFHEFHQRAEPHWRVSNSDQYSYHHSAEQKEPRIIFVSPSPDDVSDPDNGDWRWRHRRHHRRRRHEPAYPLSNGNPPYLADVPENWYRQQYTPPLPDLEPTYEDRPRRRNSYSDSHGARNYRHSSPAPSVAYEERPASPRPNWSFKSPKADPPPIYNLDTQRALEESYAQASLDRERDISRDRSSDRSSYSTTDVSIVDELDDRLHREQRRRHRGTLDRGSIDEERRLRIAELQAEIQARELQQELRNRGRELERGRGSDRRRRPSSARSGYRSPSVSDGDGLTGSWEDVRWQSGRLSPSPSLSSYRERGRYVGSLGGSSWTGNGHHRRPASHEGSIRDASEGGGSPEGYYLRPRVRFSPAVNYEPDFVRRPRVYLGSAEADDSYGGGG